VKTIGHFYPVRNRSAAEAEDHYARVHTVFARGMFRDHFPNLTYYITNRAVAMYDVNGGFSQLPRRWRFNLREFEGGWLAEWAAPLLWRDHTNCLRAATSGVVEPTTLLDRLNGQTNTAAYFFEYERGQVPRAEAQEYYRNDHLPRLRAYLEDAFGVRRAVSNQYINESIAEPLEEEGQIMTAAFREEPSRTHLEEFYFDNHTWAAEFFSRGEVRKLFNQSKLSVSGHRVIQDPGVDLR
jgi:hypothetical protein